MDELQKEIVSSQETLQEIDDRFDTTLINLGQLLYYNHRPTLSSEAFENPITESQRIESEIAKLEEDSNQLQKLVGKFEELEITEKELKQKLKDQKASCEKEYSHIALETFQMYKKGHLDNSELEKIFEPLSRNESTIKSLDSDLYKMRSELVPKSFFKSLGHKLKEAVSVQRKRGATNSINRLTYDAGAKLVALPIFEKLCEGKLFDLTEVYRSKKNDAVETEDSISAISEELKVQDKKIKALTNGERSARFFSQTVTTLEAKESALDDLFFKIGEFYINGNNPDVEDEAFVDLMNNIELIKREKEQESIKLEILNSRKQISLEEDVLESVDNQINRKVEQMNRIAKEVDKLKQKVIKSEEVINTHQNNIKEKGLLLEE